MCDECNPFERLLSKIDDGYRRLRSCLCGQLLRGVETLSPAMAQSMRHTGTGVAGGLFTGLILFGLQFTGNQDVNHMVKSLQGKFAAHYQDIPAPLFSVLLFLASCTLLLAADWGHFLRRRVLVPVIHGVSHTVSIATGMLLSSFLAELFMQNFLLSLEQWGISTFVIAAVWLLAVAMNVIIYLCQYGFVGLWRKRMCKSDKCPVLQRRYEVWKFILPLVAVFLISFLWSDVKQMAARVSAADAAKAGNALDCAAGH